jgi:hypothetical protein
MLKKLNSNGTLIIRLESSLLKTLNKLILKKNDIAIYTDNTQIALLVFNGLFKCYLVGAHLRDSSLKDKNIFSVYAQPLEGLEILATNAPKRICKASFNEFEPPAYNDSASTLKSEQKN